MSDYLPQEVLINILTRLPPKSLIKFRCVSKSWNSLISSRYFISLHNEQSLLSQPKDRLIMRRYSKNHSAEIYSVYSDTDEFHEDKNIRIENPFCSFTRFYYRIVGSSNGVLCLSDDSFGHTHSIYLWNPTIRRKVTLPLPKSTFESTWPCMCVLGFGFDVKNGDYKVVRVAYAKVESGYSVPPKVEVYALSEGNWRGVSGKFPRSWMVEYFWSQAFLNGNVHWIAYRSNPGKAQTENLITVFDLSYEVFDEMPLPEELNNEVPFNLNVAVVEESLAVYQYDTCVWSESCSIWVMKKYGDVKSWSKEFHVDLEGGIGNILGVRRNGDLLLTSRNGELIGYNADKGTLTELGVLGTKDSFYACSHFESLALLVEGEGAQERKLVKNGDEYDGGVEKVELRRHSSMLQCLMAMLEGWYM
ncbi:hypothetical protein CDL12_12169 [Handroanthus impetiginosus]|uniref:F-box domain-containing protein n=1 Tax=Handroanthus impetiginosus TaxID=429701 RepID=A0A2G9HCD5_9LAMI|nr:hypothetical protein CDL12_12169 [Handroanthus impetiginosus]